MTVDLKRIKAERIVAGLTQDDMAREMGWKSRSPYAKRENGLVDIGANELLKIAKILGFEDNDIRIFFTDYVLEKER